MQKTAGRKPPLSARRVHLGFAALFGAAALAAASSASATTYKYTQIDWLGATRTEAYGINDTGQIVGTSYDGMGSHGFLRIGGTFTPVDVPAGTNTAAEGINSAGQIVGSYYDSTGIQHGFLDSGGSFSQTRLARRRTFHGGPWHQRRGADCRVYSSGGGWPRSGISLCWRELHSIGRARRNLYGGF